MKRTTAYLALLLIFALLLSGCGKQPPVAADPTAPSQQQNTPNTTPTTQPTIPPALTLEEEYEKLIQDNQWYMRALGCVFEKPEELPAYLYFYLGVGDDTQATGEEFEFIMDAFVQKNPNGWADYGYEYTRLPVAKINEALSVFGVTIEDIQIPEQWVYNPNLDCYYFWVTDAYGVGKWSVTKVEKGTEGIVAVYWETEDDIPIDADGFSTGALLRNPKMVLTMQQQPDGTYRILSNVPQA